MAYIGPVYDETKLTPCIHCGMSERNCFSAKKAGCVSCCPKCDHSKICPTCKRPDWQDCLPPIAEKPKSDEKLERLLAVAMELLKDAAPCDLETVNLDEQAWWNKLNHLKAELESSQEGTKP